MQRKRNGPQQESRNSAGRQQERSKNNRERSKNPAGNYQGFSRAVLGMQRKQQGLQQEFDGIRQGCSRNAAKTNAWCYDRYAQGPQQGPSRAAAATQQKRQGGAAKTKQGIIKNPARL